MRRDAYRDVGGRPRLERAVEGTPAWRYAYRDVGGRSRREQAVEVVGRRREQAAEDARSRPDAALPLASLGASARRLQRALTLLQTRQAAWESVGFN